MMKINCHSSINIRGSKNLWFDPFRIDTASNNADIIFITHSHFDHLSPEDIDKVMCENTVFIAPDGVMDEAGYKMKAGDIITVDGVEIEAVPAYNRLKPFHPKKNGWLGYKVKMDEVTYYVCGDTDRTDDAEKVKCDVLLVPCGGTYTMDFKEAAKLANIIKPKKAIPTHYGSVAGNAEDGDKFRKLLDDGIECEILI